MSTGESREAPPSLASDEPPWMLSENRFNLVEPWRAFLLKARVSNGSRDHVGKCSSQTPFDNRIRTSAATIRMLHMAWEDNPAAAVKARYQGSPDYLSTINLIAFRLALSVC
jgi:hypothetical protein